MRTPQVPAPWSKHGANNDDRPGAYRSYLIKESNERTWIEKDKTFIAWAQSVSDAKRIIDNLLD